MITILFLEHISILDMLNCAEQYKCKKKKKEAKRVELLT